MNRPTFVDVIYGAAWGDEGKGKICTRLAKEYDSTARFNGGPNAGHTFYINGQKIVTHVIPTGVVFDKPSIIGPNCVVDREGLYEELNYLQSLGFDTKLVKISPFAHVITEAHKNLDGSQYQASLGTTGKGIGPCYASKAYRIGTRAGEVFPKDLLWDGQFYGSMLCEGAQAVWLDINHGAYPYTTSSECLPYSSCSLGFSPKQIRKLIAVAKMYDTRAGFDDYFGMPENMSEEALSIAKLGNEYGSTTGRPRTVKYLNVARLKKSLALSGATELHLNKGDVLEELRLFKFYYDEDATKLASFPSMQQMKKEIKSSLSNLNLDKIVFDFKAD